MTYEEACAKLDIKPLVASEETKARLIETVLALYADGEPDLRYLNLMRVQFEQCA